MNNEDNEERIGILAEANKIGQAAAEKLHAEQTKVNPFADLAERAKQRKLDNRMKKHKVDRKTMAGGK